MWAKSGGVDVFETKQKKAGHESQQMGADRKSRSRKMKEAADSKHGVDVDDQCGAFAVGSRMPTDHAVGGARQPVGVTQSVRSPNFTGRIQSMNPMKKVDSKMPRSTTAGGGALGGKSANMGARTWESNRASLSDTNSRESNSRNLADCTASLCVDVEEPPHKSSRDGCTGRPLVLGQLVDILWGLMDLQEHKACAHLLTAIADSRHAGLRLSITDDFIARAMGDSRSHLDDALPFVSYALSNPNAISAGVDRFKRRRRHGHHHQSQHMRPVSKPQPADECLEAGSSSTCPYPPEKNAGALTSSSSLTLIPEMTSASIPENSELTQSSELPNSPPVTSSQQDSSQPPAAEEAPQQQQSSTANDSEEAGNPADQKEKFQKSRSVSLEDIGEAPADGEKSISTVGELCSKKDSKVTLAVDDESGSDPLSRLSQSSHSGYGSVPQDPGASQSSWDAGDSSMFPYTIHESDDEEVEHEEYDDACDLDNEDDEDMNIDFYDLNAGNNEPSRPSRWWIIHPNSNNRVVWDSGSFVFIIVEVFVIPLSVGFNMVFPEEWYWTTTGWFTVDIFLSFITGYFSDGRLVMQQKQIARRYLLTTFILDFFSTFPWESLALISGDNTMSSDQNTTLAKVARFGKLFRIARLLRLFKLQSLLRRLEDLLPETALVVNVAFSLVKMFAVFSLLCHWSACLWGFIGSPAKVGHESRNEDPHEITDCDPGGACELGIMGSPWIHRYGLDTVDHNKVGTQYLTALHFATALMTGGEGGIVQPGYWAERVFTVVMMVVSFVVCSSILGQVVSLVEKFNSEKTQFRENMIAVTEYMRRRKVPLTLRTKVKRYLEFQYRMQISNAGEGCDFISQLSPWLRLELKEHLNSGVIMSHPIFQSLPAVPMKRVCAIARILLYAPGDIVTHRGHRALCMLFIVRGRLKVLEPKTQAQVAKEGAETEKSQSTRPVILEPPSWIGDQCLFKDMMRGRTVICLTHTELLTLPKDLFQAICAEFPKVRPLYNEWKEMVLAGDLVGAGMQCEECNGFGHTIDTCPEMLAKLKGSWGVAGVNMRNKKASDEDEDQPKTWGAKIKKAVTKAAFDNVKTIKRAENR